MYRADVLLQHPLCCTFVITVVTLVRLLLQQLDREVNGTDVSEVANA